MKVFIQLDGLVFVDLTQEQETDLMKVTENTRIKETEKGLKVLGNGAVLYKVLYDISYKYDVELI